MKRTYNAFNIHRYQASSKSARPTCALSWLQVCLKVALSVLHVCFMYAFLRVNGVLAATNSCSSCSQ